MVSHQVKGHTDSEGFTWEFNEGVSPIEEFIEYCKTVTQDQRNQIIACFTEAVKPAQVYPPEY